MPWYPSFEQAVPDPRLDPYRNRVGRLTCDGALAAWILVETGFEAEELGGHLWWRRFGPLREFVVDYVTVNHGQEEWDLLISGEALDARLTEWDQGKFSLGNRTYSVEWLEVEESAEEARRRFGMTLARGK